MPERRIAVITGDGELMMNAGALATVASAAPQNLIIVCIDNGQHGETGGQPGHTSKRTNLTTLAEGSGIASVMTVSTSPRRAIFWRTASISCGSSTARPARGLQAQLGSGRMSFTLQAGQRGRRLELPPFIWCRVTGVSHSDGDPELVELPEPILVSRT